MAIAFNMIVGMAIAFNMSAAPVAFGVSIHGRAFEISHQRGVPGDCVERFALDQDR